MSATNKNSTKKLKAGSEELIKVLIDKMLEKYGVGYDYVNKNQTLYETPWYQYYTWTQKESDEYEKWWIEFMKANVSPKYSVKYIKSSWPWFNLKYGLKIKDE